MDRKKTTAAAGREGDATGTYRYNKATGLVERVSARVPRVASKGAGSGADEAPCGEASGVCGRGACASGPCGE